MAEYNGSIELISGLIQKNNADFPLMEANAVAFYEEVQLDDGSTAIQEIRLPDKLKSVGISETEKQTLIQTAVTETLKRDEIKAFNTNIKKNAEDISDLDEELKDLALIVAENAGDNKKLIVHYDTIAKKLYLYEKDENGEIEFDPGTGTVIKVNSLSETTILGGGGGGGAAANYRLSFIVNEDTKDSFSILEGRSALLHYTVKLTEAKTDTTTNEVTYIPVTGEKITYSIYKDNIFQRSITKDTVESDSIDVTDLLTIGTNNFKITASVIEYVDGINADGEAETIAVTTRASARWTVNVVNMKLTLPKKTMENKPGWDADPFYGEIPFTYSPIGALSKTIYFILDGETIHKEVTSSNGGTLTYIIPKQSHGIHVLEVYCEGTIEGETIPTDKTKYILMCVDSSNTTSLIRLDAPDKGEQYSNLRVYFNVYDPLDEIIDAVEIFEDGVLKNTYTNITSTQQSWDYKPQTEGKKVITFKYKDKATESVTIDIAKFPYDIQPTLGDLMVDFVPTGRTNQDIDYDVFKNNAFTTVTDPETNETTQVEIPMTWTFSDNFDWVNGGWKIDENGDTYFCVKAGTNVSFNYNLFDKINTLTSRDAQDKYIPGIGKEFKLIFKTLNVARSDASWLTCMSEAANDNPTGIEMQVHNAYVKSSADVLEVPYSEEDIIEFDMNIVPMTEFSADNQPMFTSKVIPMILTYEDGTPVQPKVLTNPSTSFKQVNPKPILVGSEYCDVHIYRMKIYERYLSEAEILNNFIADARTGEEMSKRYKRNQIYLPGQTSFMGEEQELKALAEACPDLRVYLLSAPYFTNDKDDKVGNTTIKQWYYKNGKDSIEDNWIATGATHRGQGTSSNEYGYAGRNLDFDMKKAEITLGDNKTKVSKISLTPTSVPTNYLNYKTNIASSEHANNALLAKRYDRFLPYETIAAQLGAEKGQDVKNSMEFYNCVVFIQETNTDLSTHREFNDTKIHFYGIGNIGDSKKTDSSRINDKDDTKEFVVEIMDWNRDLSNFPIETRKKAAKYKDKNKNYIFLTNKYLADRALFEKVGGEYVTAPKDEEFNASEYYFELIDGNYVVTTDSTNKNLLDPEDPESGYEDKTYYIYVGGEFKLSDDTEINLTKAYYIDILEYDDFSEDFTYGWRYITEYEEDEKKVSGEELEENKRKNKEVQAAARKIWKDFYRFITRDLTTDGKEDENKIAAWKNEFKDWFISDSAFYYYLFTLRYTMVDNRAKNSFWHYGICPDGKYRFEFWDYDNDTALGIDNAGKLEIPFGVEDADTDKSGAPYFRAYDSTFFARIAKYFENELNDMWSRVEQNTALGNAFNSTNFINEFDTWQEQFPEELWRLDYERKYKRTYVGGSGVEWDNALPKIANGKQVKQERFLTEMMNGRKKYQRRQFERNQEIYMSSKFFGSKNKDDSITLRGAGGSTAHAIPAKYILTVTPFNNMYLNLHDGTNIFYHSRVYAGQTYTINLLEGLDKLDLLYIRGASNLQSLGDLSLMYLQTATLGMGARLKNIILGNKNPNYENAALGILEIGASNKLLEELDIRNLDYLTKTDLPVTSIPSLKRVYAQGSNIQIVRFANNGLLEEAYLPASITQLQMENLYFLKTLEVESYANLTDLTIRNCSNVVNALDIINQAPKLNRLRLTNINWNLPNTDLLNQLLKIDSVLTGYVYVPGIRKTEEEAYKKAWPDLVVKGGIDIVQHTVTFLNDDNTLLGTIYVDSGDYCPDPIATGLFETPVKQFDVQYKYIFNGWFGIKAFEDRVYEDRVYTATYNKIIQQYEVQWVDKITEDFNKVYHSTMVEYGKEGFYQGEEEIPSKAPIGNSTFFLFDKWNKSTAYITGPTIVEAVWAQATVSEVKNKITNGTPINELEPVEIYALAQSDSITGNLFKGTSVQVQLGYMPTRQGNEQVLVSEPYDFKDKKTYLRFDDINLFDTSKDFTIAIDFTPGYNNGNAHYLSCGPYGGNKSGLFIRQVLNNPNVEIEFVDQKTNINPSGHFPSVDKTYREICVLRHKKGENGKNTLFVYTNDRYSLGKVQCKEIVDNGIIEGNIHSQAYPLIIGGSISSLTGSVQNIPTNGIINYAKIWYEDLGHEECLKCCSWIYTKLNFDYCAGTPQENGIIGSSRYYTTSGAPTKASFICQDLLDELYPMFVATTEYTTDEIKEKIEQRLNDDKNNPPLTGGWGITDLKEWMNSKLFNGFSIHWQQMIQDTVINSMRGGTSQDAKIAGGKDFIHTLRQDIRKSNNYLYLPSLAEVNTNFNKAANEVTDTNPVYREELVTDLCVTSYDMFGGNDTNSNNNRIKTLNGNPQTWLLRTPYWSNNVNTDVLANYWNTVSKTGKTNATSTYEEDSYGKRENFRSYTPFGICPCFSI